MSLIKTLSENSWEAILKNCSSEKSFQTTLTNYYQKNYSKQYLQTIIREIISNNFYELPEKALKTILTNYYSRNNFKKYLLDKSFQTILIRETISNKTYNLLIMREVVSNSTY